MVTRAEILGVADAWIGTPYCHQASLRQVGSDCLDLIRGVWREVMGPEPEAVPAYARGWAEARGGELLAQAAARHLVAVPPQAARPGDVLLFRWRPGLAAKHAAILDEDGFMIHAQDGARVARVHYSQFWKDRLAFAFRFPGITD